MGQLELGQLYLEILFADTARKRRFTLKSLRKPFELRHLLSWDKIVYCSSQLVYRLVYKFPLRVRTNP